MYLCYCFVIDTSPTEIYTYCHTLSLHDALPIWFTANVGDRAQVYAIANYYQTKSFASFTPLGFNGSPTPPNNGAAPYNVLLPVYVCADGVGTRSEEHTSELQSLMRTSYAVFCLKKNIKDNTTRNNSNHKH